MTEEQQNYDSEQIAGATNEAGQGNATQEKRADEVDPPVPQPYNPQIDLNADIKKGMHGYKKAGWEMERHQIDSSADDPVAALNARDAEELNQALDEIKKENLTRKVPIDVDPIRAGTGVSAKMSPLDGATDEITQAEGLELPVSSARRAPHASGEVQQINGITVANEFLVYYQGHAEIGAPRNEAQQHGNLIFQEFEGALLTSENGQVSADPLGTMSKLDGENRRKYVVQMGETLWDIAYKFYGNGGEYPRILGGNAGVISDTDVLMPGTELYIP